MGTRSKQLDAFTGQYQVQKTLRFELKPQGKTEEWIQKHGIIGVKHGELTGKDAKRAENYKYTKLLIDMMHRQFIEEALNLDKDDKNVLKLKECVRQICESEKIQITKELRNAFKKVMDSKANEWKKEYTGKKEPKKSGIDLLFSNEDTIKLLKWKIEIDDIKPTFKDLEQGNRSDDPIPKDLILDYISEFDNFHTYFTGFNENRENIYNVKDNISTSLIHRTFAENLLFHLENIKRWQKVKISLVENQDILREKGYDWQGKLDDCEKRLEFSADEIFKPESFIDFINQSGIDRYNKILGGLAAEGGKNKAQGLNEFINLTRQQTAAKSRQFPNLKGLYKQILSKNDKSFIEAFEEDPEMIDAVKKFHGKFIVNDDDLVSLPVFVKDIKKLSENLKAGDENIYIAKEKLRSISIDLTGSWDTIENQLLARTTENKYQKTARFSVKDINDAISEYIREFQKAENELKPLKEEYMSGVEVPENILHNFFNKRLEELVRLISKSWTELDENGALDEEKLDSARENEEDKGFKQTACIKQFLDSSRNLWAFVKDWNMEIKEIPEDAFTDWYDCIQNFVDNFPVINLYNKTRNHLTQKAYSKDKVKINFEKSTLLNGWDRNKESANFSIILERDGLFYLAVMTPGNNDIFGYDEIPGEIGKKKEKKENLRKLALAGKGENCYRKMNYKQIANVGKDIFTLCWDNKENIAIRKTKGREKIWGNQITRIKETKSYSDNTEDRLVYFSYLIRCAKSYWKHFNLQLKRPEEYKTMQELLTCIGNQGYKISFDNIKESYIEENVDKGNLYLFQIYNKDFSRNKKAGGKDNLHTSYWKLLFDEDNLKDNVLKLNGQAEIFFRQASVKWSEEKMKKGHHYEKLKDKFDYPIIKDRRFTQDKFFFHCPITLNNKAPSNPARFNSTVRNFLKKNPEVNVIGIDRGEKHLLYYSVVDRQGNIIEQNSFNTISTGFKPAGQSQEQKIDYRRLLDEKEKNRDKARKSWSAIENIKELKAGYLSQVVHKLAQLIINYNAIVVLEDLNYGFKRGRFKVEKQVYQKFERALIDKLNYLVFKDRENRLQPGHYLNAYQLTNKFESFKKLGSQSGILFYTAASYTSTTDPVSGFMKNVYYTYSSIDKAVEFWKSFDSIIYNAEQNRIEFTYTLEKIMSKKLEKEKDEKSVEKTSWTVVSSVQRSKYIKKDRKTEILDVNTELKKLLDSNRIEYKDGADLRNRLAERNERGDASFHKSMVYYFNSILNIRASNPQAETGTGENDFIMSPVEPFFDSRKKYPGLPLDGDANGAYNIARKGIFMLNTLNNSENPEKENLNVSKKDWQNFAQADETVKRQKAKMK